MTGTIGQAFELALAAHAGQTDKSGEPYVAHLVRVAARLPAGQAQVVALLHDILEDTPTPAAQVGALFGPVVLAAVQALTKSGGESYEGYLARVAANPLALSVKLADLADNSAPLRLALLDPATRDRLSAKYARARAILKDHGAC